MKRAIKKRLTTARAAVERSHQAGAATQETRELRTAVSALIEAIERLEKRQ